MLYSIGKDSSVHAPPGREGVRAGAAAVPVHARRHDVEVPGHVRVPRPRMAEEHGDQPARARERGRRRARDQPVRQRLGRAHRRDEDRGGSSRRSTSTASTRPSAARGATRRSRARRSGSSPSARPSTVGPEEPAARAVAALQRAPPQAASRSASSRSRTGPSSTCGSTSTARRSRSCRLYFARERPVVDRDGTWIMVDDDLERLEPGEEPELKRGALPHPRLLPALGRDRVGRRHAAEDHPGDAPRRERPSGRAG